MIAVLVTIEPLADRFEDCVGKLDELLALVRAEPGCGGVQWGVADGVPRRIAIVERYADAAALAAHHASAHMATLGPAVMSLCAAPPAALMFEER